MTRINCIDVELLTPKEFGAEWHELPRLFSQARNAYWHKNWPNTQQRIPTSYTMGTGHVLFFYDKIGFIARRYMELAAEGVRRGININDVPLTELLHVIPKSLQNDWVPDAAAIACNMQRLLHQNPNRDVDLAKLRAKMSVSDNKEFV